MKIETKHYDYNEEEKELTFDFHFSESMEEHLAKQILACIALNYMGKVYDGYADDFEDGVLKIDLKKKEVSYKF